MPWGREASRPHDAYDPNVREYHLDALPVKLLEHTK